MGSHACRGKRKRTSGAAARHRYGPPGATRAPEIRQAEGFDGGLPEARRRRSAGRRQLHARGAVRVEGKDPAARAAGTPVQGPCSGGSRRPATVGRGPAGRAAKCGPKPKWYQLQAPSHPGMKSDLVSGSFLRCCPVLGTTTPLRRQNGWVLFGRCLEMAILEAHCFQEKCKLHIQGALIAPFLHGPG